MSVEPSTSQGAGLFRSGMVRATVAMLVLLVAVAVVLTAFDDSFADVSEGWRMIVGLALAIVPALLWLALFYAMDRLEPEPHQYVLGLLVLGALLGGAVQQPLLRGFFQIHRWMQVGTFAQLTTDILVTGVLTAALIYAAVRFTVLPTAEFDERPDGIIYGTAVALGLGIAANMSYLADNGALSIGVGTLQIIVTSLAYATFGALVGYSLGLVKPGGAPVWYGGVGVLVAAVVHGLYLFVTRLFEASTTTRTYNPWPSLLCTAIFAAVVFAVVFFLLHRSVGRSAVGQGEQR